MNRRYGTPSRWILGLGLLAALAWNSERVAADTQLLTIPIVRSSEQAPAVDGRMLPGEWDHAAALTGLVSSDAPALSQRQAMVYFLSDGQYLYVGMHSPAVPEGTSPQVVRGATYPPKVHADIAGNDRVEIRLDPPGESGAKGAYYLAADSADHHFDEQILGTEHRRWNGPWEAKSSADGNAWTWEMRIKAESLGLVRVADGQAWKLNFSRVWLFPLQYAGLVRQPHDTFEARFIEGAPAVRVNRLGALARGELDVELAVREYEGVVNTPKEGLHAAPKVDSSKLAGSGRSVVVRCELVGPDGEILLGKEQTLALAPAAMRLASFKHSFKVAPRQELRLLVQESGKEGRALYRSTLPLAPWNEAEARAWTERLQKGEVVNSWRLNAAFFPYWEKAKIQPIFFLGKLRDQAVAVRVVIASDRNFKAEARIPVKNGEAALADVAIPGLPEGTYTTTAEVMDVAGKVLSTLQSTYVRKVFPWEHNPLGISRRVIKPWTPMSVSGASVRTWGRDYQLAGSGLPGQIVSRDRPILDGSVQVELTTGGQRVLMEAQGAPRFSETAEDRVKWTGQADLGGELIVETKGLAEYDGFSWFEMTLRPRAPLPVERLRVLIPVDETTAQLMHFQSQWARTNFSGAIPAGSGTVFDSLRNPHYGRPGGFSPHVWVGNLNRGLSWFADSDEGWSSVATKPAIEIIREPGRVLLALNVINRPVTLDKPRTVRMGLMATPVKPLITPLKNIRTRAVNWLGADNKTVFQAFMYAAYPKDFDYAAADRELAKLAAGYDGVRLYFNKHELGAAYPELAVFDHEWGGMEPSPSYPGAPERFPEPLSRTVNRHLTDSRIDMQVYYISELARKTRMAGTYWDITGTSPGLPMVENGTAYVDEEGRLVPTFDQLKSRQLFKRVATAWQEIRGEPDFMEIHSTNHIGLPFYSFAFNLLNFEWLWPGPKMLRADGVQQDFMDTRPLDLFATEGVPSQFGFWVKSIDHLVLKDPKDLVAKRRIERSAQALGGLHNHLTGPSPQVGRRDELEFIGYWDEKGRLSTVLPRTKASLWRKGGELEIILANLELKRQDVDVTLDTVALGITRVEKAWDRESGEPLPRESAAMVGGKLRLSLPVEAHDYRLVRVSSE